MINIPNRTLCDVLKEMRTCYKTRNFSYLISLVEEAQHLGNKMEASLWDQSDLKSIREDIKQAKEELISIKTEVRALENLKGVIS